MDKPAGTDNRPDYTLAITCAVCGDPLPDSFGWCSQCRMAFCFACGRKHFCHATCRANGCIAGLCVRLVIDGVLSERWGLPPDEEIAAMRGSE